jgi:hypothetical protein
VAAVIVYGEHVEPPLARNWHRAQEVAGDHRELAILRGAVVAGDDRMAPPAQVKIRVSFAAPAGTLVRQACPPARAFLLPASLVRV